MALNPGTTLGPYQIPVPLAATARIAGTVTHLLDQIYIADA